MKERFEAYRYGQGVYDWGIREIFTNETIEPRPLNALCWLTEQQARAIAHMLNNMAGFKWVEYHPDWLAEVKIKEGEKPYPYVGDNT